MEAQKQKKVIVWALNDFLVGGAQRLAIDIIRELGNETYEWHIMTFFEFPERSTMYDQLPDFVTVHRYAFAGARDVRSWMRVWRDMRIICPQAVLSNAFFSNFVTRVLKLFLGYRISIVEHNTHRDKSRFHIFLDQFLAIFTFKIVAVSEEVLRFTSWQEDITEKKFLLIRNGVDLRNAQKIATQNIPRDEHLLISVARLVEQKNPRLVLRAFAEFKARPNKEKYRLVFVGDGKLENELKEMAVQLGVVDSVEFPGFVDPYPYYAAARLMVSASIIEGFGLVYIEGMSCGLPVLATRNAGTDEFFEEGKNGFVVEQGVTPAEYARVLEAALEQPIEEFERETKKTAQKYSLGSCVEGYRALFADMLNR